MKSKVGAFGRQHRRCPVALVSCTCVVPESVFYACCGYWCSECKGHVKKEMGDGSKRRLFDRQ